MTASEDERDVGRPILSPAVRRYQGQPAGIVTRLLANTIDLGVVVGLLVVGYLGLSGVLFLWNTARFHFPTFGRFAVVLVGACLLLLYLAVSWGMSGRTYGDHVLGLAVHNRRGGRPHAGLATVRAALCLVFPIGILWVAVSPANRSLQDVVLRTRVVYDWGLPQA